jgi:crotonobetainyl-CoA:carnitine CoA-transferase CaiB-like acyl-CoA transferase
MSPALEGVRIVDVSQWYFGPVATAHLADLGAEVIHVESPRGGDGGRGVISTRAIPVSDWNSYFDTNNRNKKSLAVNLQTDEGREIVYKLVRTSDVFSSNMTRPALRKMGLEYKTLRQFNPDIIYAFASGYGRFGPDKDKEAYDVTGIARSGIMMTLAEPGEPPVYTGVATGDATAALVLAWGIMMALYHRERTGKGQEVDVSLFGSALSLGSRNLQGYLSTGLDYFIHQHSRKQSPNPLWNIYQTKDRWIYLCMRETDRFWPNFCKCMGIEELEHDSRFGTHEKRCAETNREKLISLLAGIFPTRSLDEWLERFDNFGLVAGPVNTFAELVSDPQVWDNQYIVRVEHPNFEEVAMVGFPVQFDRTPGNVRSIGPELGQHTEEILVENLGYSWDEVTRLKDQKVII